MATLETHRTSALVPGRTDAGLKAGDQNRLYPTDDWIRGAHAHVTLRHLTVRTDDARGRPKVFDSLFPMKIEGYKDCMGIDEAAALLLTGLVQTIAPRVALETGTHKGRSARAIVDGLRAAREFPVMPGTFTATLHEPGHLHTVDVRDFGAMRAFSQEDAPYVSFYLGETPGCYQSPPLRDIHGIEFAFLDGDHSKEGLLADLQFVRDHMAEECWVAIDNATDEGWPGVAEAIRTIPEPGVILPTQGGLALYHFVKEAGSVQPEHGSTV